MKICINCDARYDGEDWRCPVCNFTPEHVQGYLSFAPDLGDVKDHYDADFFKRLIAVEEGHFWFEARTQILTWVLDRYAPDAGSFLEIGCGTGFVLSRLQRAFPSLSVSGAELLFDGLTYSRSRIPDAPLFQMDARRIPFESEFDVVGAFDVVEHIREDETVIAQMYQGVRPGGIMVLTVPQHRFLWSQYDVETYHQRRYTRSELLEKVRRAGFQVTYVTSFVTLLLPVMFLWRLKYRFSKRRAASDFDVVRELQVNGMLNRPMSSIMKLELAMIRKGLLFPIGGSLLVVARKPSEPALAPAMAGLR